MVFFNSTDVLGILLLSMTETTTGDLFISLFMLFMFLLVACIMFGIPTELSAVILLPWTLVTATYYSQFVAPLGIIIIYLTFIIVKSLPFR